MPTSLLHTYLFWIPCVQWDLMKFSQEWKHRLVLVQVFIRCCNQLEFQRCITQICSAGLHWQQGSQKSKLSCADFKWKGSVDEKKLGWCSSFDLGFQTCLQQRIWWGLKQRNWIAWSAWPVMTTNKETVVKSKINNGINKQSHTIQVSMTLNWQAWKYDYIWIKRQKQRGQRKLLMLLSIQYS